MPSIFVTSQLPLNNCVVNALAKLGMNCLRAEHVPRVAVEQRKSFVPRLCHLGIVLNPRLVQQFGRPVDDMSTEKPAAALATSVESEATAFGSYMLAPTEF